MIGATIGDLLDGQLDGREDIQGCIIYVVRDGDITLYVGKAARVIERLWSHLGDGSWGWTGTSQLGRLIKANMPIARTWHIEFMTGKDCLLVLEKCTGQECLTGADGISYLLLNSYPLDNGTRVEQRLTATNVEELESELIHACHPCLNSADNPEPTPLPQHYQVPWRKLGDSSWQAVAELLMPEHKARREQKKKKP